MIDWSKNSKVYKLYLMEKDEIERLKWIESEKAGYDIGTDHAYFLWVRYHRLGWIAAVFQSGAN